MTSLKRILSARRNDLVDGFPTRAVLAACKSDKPLQKLNELLRQNSIQVSLLAAVPPTIIPNPHLLKFGIIYGCMSGDIINIGVASEFFTGSDSTVIVRALCFQSVCLHQLIHRDNGRTRCQIFQKPLEEVVNDDDELEAIAAGLAHDVRCKEHLTVTGFELLHDLSPRLANMLDNSYAFQSGSLTKLQSYIAKFV